MSQLRPAGLGPIVGHVTQEGARVWIRAGDPDDSGAILAKNRRTLGVIAVCEKGKRFTQGRVHYFRLHREYDRTGTFTLGFEAGITDAKPSAKLAPDTEYVVRVGTLAVDDPHPNEESLDSETLADRLPQPGVWLKDLQELRDEQSLATFRTAPAPAAGQGDLAFLLGSCRYPGLLWKAKHADKIFGPMLREAQGGDGRPPARFTLMVGDQIYADRMNRKIDLARADTFEEFQERSRAGMSSISRSTPTNPTSGCTGRETSAAISSTPSNGGDTRSSCSIRARSGTSRTSRESSPTIISWEGRRSRRPQSRASSSR
jgi:alkaline phosphatase D